MLPDLFDVLMSAVIGGSLGVGVGKLWNWLQRHNGGK